MSETTEKIFKEYEQGIAFKESMGLFKTVNEAERLFAGDQWAGLSASNMPKPVFNIIKRIIQYKVAAVMLCEKVSKKRRAQVSYVHIPRRTRSKSCSYFHFWIFLSILSLRGVRLRKMYIK